VSAFGLTGLDIVVLAGIGLSAVVALARGFVREVLAIAGWVGAAIGTLQLFPLARQIANKYIEIQIIADIVAGLVLFVAILVALSMLAHAIAKQVQQSSVNLLDRSLGFLFGLARGAVLVCLAYLLLSLVLVPKEQPDYIQKMKLLGLVQTGADWLYKFVPPEYRRKGEGAARDAKSAVEQGLGAKRVYDSLGGDPAKPPPDSGPEKGYKAEDRQRIEQLLRTNPSK
jgi:membrane protein required for colicin V production